MSATQCQSTLVDTVVDLGTQLEDSETSLTQACQVNNQLEAEILAQRRAERRMQILAQRHAEQFALDCVSRPSAQQSQVGERVITAAEAIQAVQREELGYVQYLANQFGVETDVSTSTTSTASTADTNSAPCAPKETATSEPAYGSLYAECEARARATHEAHEAGHRILPAQRMVPMYRATVDALFPFPVSGGHDAFDIQLVQTHFVPKRRTHAVHCSTHVPETLPALPPSGSGCRASIGSIASEIGYYTNDFEEAVSLLTPNVEYEENGENVSQNAEVPRPLEAQSQADHLEGGDEDLPFDEQYLFEEEDGGEGDEAKDDDNDDGSPTLPFASQRYDHADGDFDITLEDMARAYRSRSLTSNLGDLDRCQTRCFVCMQPYLDCQCDAQMHPFM